MKTWHEASTSDYCSRELKRNSKVVYYEIQLLFSSQHDHLEKCFGVSYAFRLTSTILNRVKNAVIN